MGCATAVRSIEKCEGTINEQCDNYGRRKGTIQKYFANKKKYSQITGEKFDKSKKLLHILRKLLDPLLTFSKIRKYFANPRFF